MGWDRFLTFLDDTCMFERFYGYAKRFVGYEHDTNISLITALPTPNLSTPEHPWAIVGLMVSG